MKMKYRFMVVSLFALLVVCNIVVLADSISTKDSGTLKLNGPRWVLSKQEIGTTPYISDRQRIDPLICEVYPVKDAKDVPTKTVYTTIGKTTQKQVTKQLVGDNWANCYQVKDERYVQIGEQSTIYVYQNYSTVEYVDGDNNDVVTTFLLEKFNGTDYAIEPQNIWLKSEEECASLGKEGLCFGATDDSMAEEETAKFRYTVTTTDILDMDVVSGEKNEYPVFYTNYTLEHWGNRKQEYSFKDICNKDYSMCKWNLEGTVATIDFVSTKYIDPTVFPGGNGTYINPYQITNCTYLQAMNESLTSHYILMNDIDCSGINFEPIKIASIFSGSLNGQGYTISNLKINYGTTNRVGLFADLNGNVTKVNIANSQVIGSYDVGIMAGYQRGGSITDSSVSGTVQGTSNTGNIGGFVGRILGSSKIFNSTANRVNVTNTASGAINIGGFVGLCGGSASITNCTVNTANVTARGTSSQSIGGFVGRAETAFSYDYANDVVVVGGGAGYVGGFVGYAATVTSNMTHCYATGTANATGNFLGGFVGRTASSLTNCYAWVDVSTISDYVGGFIGYLLAGTTIMNSYSIGQVNYTTATYRGGFAGRNSGGVINSSYYDTNTSKMSDVGKGTPLSTVLMKQQASFIGWDFVNVWDNIENVTYPTFIVGVSAPSYSNIKVYPPSPFTYTIPQSYQFNVTWQGSSSISSVIIEHNFTGTLQNYTVLSYVGNEYYYTYGNLSVGYYVWKEYANDSTGLWGVTPQQTYQVVKIVPTLSLTIYPSWAEYEGTLTIVNCTATNGVTPNLYRNSVLISIPDTQYHSVGSYYYECNYTGNNTYQGVTVNNTLYITAFASDPIFFNCVDSIVGNNLLCTASFVYLNNTPITTSSGTVTIYNFNNVFMCQGNIVNMGGGAYRYTQILNSSFVDDSYYAILDATHTYANYTYPFVVSGQIGQISAPTISSYVWNYTNRSLTQTITASVDTNAISAAVWGYTNRTLTGFGSLVSDIWNYTARFIHGEII